MYWFSIHGNGFVCSLSVFQAISCLFWLMVIKEDLVVDWEVEERENLEMIGVADEDELKGIDDTGSYIFTLRAAFCC